MPLTMPSTLKHLPLYGAFAGTLLLADTAMAVTIDTFQFNGALVVEAGAGATPATIEFVPDFTILSQNGDVTGDLIGLVGNIGGVYEFADPAGASSVSLTNTLGPNLTIDDGVSDFFSADIELIELLDGGGGTIFGAIDFSSSSYGGANAGLIALDDLIQNTPDMTVTFQTLGGSGVDLDDLFQNGSGGVATYSAAVDVGANPPVTVPEPAPLALLGLGLLCSAGFAYRRRKASSET